MNAQQKSYQVSGLFGPVIYQTHYKLNGTDVTNAKRSNNHDSANFLLTTLKLEKDDKLTVIIGGSISKFNCPKTTYLEGRLVSVINE